MSSAESGLSNDLSALVLGVDGHCGIFCELLPTLAGYPDTAFRLLWSFFCSLESVHQNKLFTGNTLPSFVLSLSNFKSYTLIHAFFSCSFLQLFQELLIRKNYFSWAVSTPGLIDVVLRSDVLNFSRITIAFLHCDLMRASLPFSAFCIS